MRRFLRLSTIGLVAAFAVACTSQASPSASPSASLQPSLPSATPSQSTPSDGSPSTSPDSSAEPTASEDLGPFTCELPIVEDATVARANITDVRVGEHDGYDRVVFEFAQGLPEITVDRATPPFTHDASGMPIDVAGDSFLRLTMRGGTKQTDTGTSSYDGPTEFEPDFEVLEHLVEAGDFEGQSTWYFGLDDDDGVCVRVIGLEGDGSPRLVIDLEH
jgi:hypothetical protein